MLSLSKARHFSPVIFVFLTLVLASTSHGQDLIVAPADSPMYRLSNFRTDTGQFGRLLLIFDYKRTRASKNGDPRIGVSGKTKDRQIVVETKFPKAESGTFRMEMRNIVGGKDFELYLTTYAGSDKSYLVSNTIRLGNPGPATRARNFTAAEKEAIAKAKLAATPPANIPDGFQAVDSNTSLVAGIPIKAGRNAKWEDAELISAETGGMVTVKFWDSDGLKRLYREKWLAVSSSVLKDALANPKKFSPSVNVLPNGGSVAIPRDAVPLPKDVTFPVGTPLKLEYHHSKWHDVFVVKDNGADIELRYKGYGANWDKTKSRDEFIVTRDTLKALKSPKSVKQFAKNVAEESTSGGATAKSNVKIKRYKVSIDLPRGAKFVPDDISVEKGTPLAACYASKWNPITAISENEDGSLHVHWDDYGDSFNCNMLRSELIIENRTLAKLKKKKKTVADSVDSEKLKTDFRMWTDSTGNHKIEAVYDSHSDTEVTLNAKSGKVITMPLDKLSKEDRDLLSKIGQATDNPFETFSK